MKGICEKKERIWRVHIAKTHPVLVTYSGHPISYSIGIPKKKKEVLTKRSKTVSFSV